MDVFSFRDRVIEDYGQFSRSFTQIKAPDLQSFVDGTYGKGEYWPSPLIQLNPSFVSGGAISFAGDEAWWGGDCIGHDAQSTGVVVDKAFKCTPPAVAEAVARLASPSAAS